MSVPEPNLGAGGAGTPYQQRAPKSSVLRSFMTHRRNNSDGAGLPSPPLVMANDYGQLPLGIHVPSPHEPLGELQRNQQDQASSSPKKQRDDSAPKSPTKSAFATLSSKSRSIRDSAKLAKSRETSPTKPKKAKSATSLAGLLTRPKSMRNLRKLADDAEAGQAKDKENRTPPDSAGSMLAPPTPIYAQFASQAPEKQLYRNASNEDHIAPFDDSSKQQPPVSSGSSREGVMMKKLAKPQSQAQTTKPNEKSVKGHGQGDRSTQVGEEKNSRRQTWARGAGTTRPSHNASSRTNSANSQSSEPSIDPKDINKYLEAMLDRRNIPENQRYKMRNLSDTIKMEFIRQDWVESQAAKPESPSPSEGEPSVEAADVTATNPAEVKKKKHRSMTISIGGGGKSLPSPTKKQKTAGTTVGRHFRNKSVDSIVSDRPSSAASTSSMTIISKIKGQHGPLDFVSYLRKVQKPEAVEVGKLHKLRLLLRNETVAWTEEFIRQGGMKETVELLHRTMEVEWREEHEDALLHENLLCLKALCTTGLALQYLHSIHEKLLPALLHMIFDPEKKGPSEFTTRNIITSILLTYIECAAPQERISRAQTILSFLRDPEGKEEERPVSFVLEMRRERPYRVWCKEAVSVTKEVFWIFLHHLNVVALPSETTAKTCDPASSATAQHQTHPRIADGDYLAYMARHFPQPRPPVPAAPYVGGVEWDATNYLASHLDLLNALVACTGPSAAERNALRAQLRVSGWERCLGGSLRTCKEKFYGAVHDGLRTWVAAAAEDGWEFKDVRYGPPPESRPASPVKKKKGGAKAEEAPPKIEMPKLSFDLEGKGGCGEKGEMWIC